MTPAQTLGLVVIVAVFVRVAWWMIPLWAHERAMQREEQRRRELARWMKQDMQRETQLERLSRLQTRRDDDGSAA